MPLPSEYIPLSSSLRSRVCNRFAPSEGPADGEMLNRQELVGYLARSKDTDSSVLATIQRRAAKDNRKVNLDSEDHALLLWVGEAFSKWETRYSLESPLSDQIGRLLPLTAAMALSDDSFCIPGAHPIHQLLDALQYGAVGWQRRLDRAGQMLEQRVERAVDKALEWFRDDKTDLAAVTRELVAANERDAARAQRMVQRLAETEGARLKTLNARRDAAREINRGLSKYKLPAAIGEFLTGPWYDSAQLVLIKFGDESTEWDQMRRATQHLMQSVQPVEADSDTDRDRQQQILRHLPAQLRRWLLSLEHDQDATDSAIGLVEYAHLRLQHGQQLQLARNPPIQLDADELESPENDDEPLQTGQWYRFEDDEGELRAQLVLQLSGGEHLLFANFVGLKALDLPRRVFNQRLEDSFAVALQFQHTFSVSLAGAAGIDSEEQLENFKNPKAAPEQASSTRTAKPQSSDISASDPLPASGTALASKANAPQEWSLGPDERDAEYASYDDALDPVLAPPAGAEVAEVEELELSTAPVEVAAAVEVLELELEAPRAVPDSMAMPSEAPTAPAPAPAPEMPTQEFAPATAVPQPAPVPSTPNPAPQSSSTPIPTQPVAPVPPAQPPAAPIPTAPPPAPPPAAPIPTAPPPAPPPAAPIPTAPPLVTATVAPSTATPMAAPVPAPAAPAVSPVPAAPPPPPPPASSVVAENPAKPSLEEIDVPMGAWLGFHDGETPIMAKLAVFDPRRENYIFVNRKGIAMRELNKAELADLIDKGLVDILETRCYFRDEVERAREEDS